MCPIIAVFVSERQIDGQAFASLNREDLHIIYPSHEKFLLTCKLYKLIELLLIQQVRIRYSYIVLLISDPPLNCIILKTQHGTISLVL